MAEEIRARAEAALKDVETITATLLPEPKGEIVAADAADPVLRAEIDRRASKVHVPGFLIDTALALKSPKKPRSPAWVPPAPIPL